MEDAIPVGKIINKLLESYHLKSKFDETNLIAEWEILVGHSISKRTKNVFLRNKILFVEMRSSSLKHDLSLLKDQILETIHKKFGLHSIHKIVLLVLVMVFNCGCFGDVLY